MWNIFGSSRGSTRQVRPAPSALVDEVLADVSVTGRILDPGQMQVIDRLSELEALPNGIYLHGDVGRGKSWLADRLYSRLPEPKRRLHAHEFLADINAAIARRAKSFAHGGSRLGPREDRSTSELIASVVAGYEYIMLDDFHVHDVADGELLLIVLREMSVRGTFMLLTSNYPPDSLLPNPLFHDTFQPAIDLIKENCEVVTIAEGHDYRHDARHEKGFSSGTWTTTGSEAPERAGRAGDGSPRDVQGAKGDVSRTVGTGAYTASFGQLCESPWSAADYFELMRDIGRLKLIAVPAPVDIDDDAFQRFAFLIDALVDQDVRCDLESVAARSAFAAAANLPRDADRMLSRLALLRDTA